jgi:hypothetical protein
VVRLLDEKQACMPSSSHLTFQFSLSLTSYNTAVLSGLVATSGLGLSRASEVWSIAFLSWGRV